jgi:TolB protein
VYATNLDTVPIAMLPFQAKGGTTLTRDLPWQIVGNDLEFCGRFKVLRADKVDSAVFAQNRIGLYIDGEYTVEGSMVTIDCYIHDAVSREQLVGKKYKGELGYLRTMSHRFSNQIVEMIFGDRGFFESKIVFVRKEGINKNLFVMDFDGQEQRRLTNTNTVNVFPAFMDSNTIVWTSFLRGKPDIYKGSTTTGKSQVFLYSRYIQTSPAVSTVVGKIAYACSKTGNLEIYTCDLDGGNATRLTFTKSINTSPCWSPNGYQIAFTSDRSGSPQIYVMDADAANVRRLTFNGKYQDSPAWSPKGDRIAYSSQVDGKFDIWTIEPDGSHATRITSSGGANVYPAWSADGSMIIYANTSGGKSDIFAVRSDGSKPTRITSGGISDMPDWSHQ